MRTEGREEQEQKVEQKGQEERDETTKGKEAPADIETKLQRRRIIFRKESTKFIDASYIV